MPKVAAIMKKKDKEPLVRYDSKADAIYILTRKAAGGGSRGNGPRRQSGTQ